MQPRPKTLNPVCTALVDDALSCGACGSLWKFLCDYRSAGQYLEPTCKSNRHHHHHHHQFSIIIIIRVSHPHLGQPLQSVLHTHSVSC